MTPDEAAAVLGIRADADEADIDRAYRRLARELHPDRYAGAADTAVRAASDRFVEATRATRCAACGSAAPRARAGRGRRRRDGPTARGHPSDTEHRVVERPGRWMPRHPSRPVGPFSWRLVRRMDAAARRGRPAVVLGGPPCGQPIDLWARILLLVASAHRHGAITAAPLESGA